MIKQHGKGDQKQSDPGGGGGGTKKHFLKIVRFTIHRPRTSDVRDGCVWGEGGKRGREAKREQ